MLTTSIESILFASGKPVSFKALQQSLSVSAEVVKEAIDDIEKHFNTETSGIHLIKTDADVQLVTNPAESERLSTHFKQELTGELTRPSLETLTIIAYRGPVTKPEIEQIRGVNCSLILRNLLMRGLIEETESVEKLQPVYSVSPEFLRHMGLHAVSELPSFPDFHDNEQITRLLSNTPAP